MANKFGYLTATERASAPTTPDAGDWAFYFKSDGPYVVDDTGTETGLVGAGGASSTLTVSDETGTAYTVVSGDSGKLKRFTAAAAVTVTLPDALAVGTVVEIMAYGAGGVTIQGNGTSTVRNAGSLLQYETASAVVVATNEWVVTGPTA